jgi:hypothetical protein
MLFQAGYAGDQAEISAIDLDSMALSSAAKSSCSVMAVPLEWVAALPVFPDLHGRRASP